MITPQNPRPPTFDIGIPKPVPACRLDRHFTLRHGTASLAARVGALKASIRPGRGGLQAWVMPGDALAWFELGCPTVPGGKS